MPFSWKDVPDDIKRRVPAPPERSKFDTQDEYEEARGYWQSHIGRVIGLRMQAHQASLRKYTRHAQMLVPKFACRDDKGWHIQWPKDDPTVIFAATEDELVALLATRLEKFGRVGNVGPHVPAANNCPTCL